MKIQIPTETTAGAVASSKLEVCVNVQSVCLLKEKKTNEGEERSTRDAYRIFVR